MNDMKGLRTPAEVLQDIVAESNHTQLWWARRLGYSQKHFCQLCTGKVRVTVDFAVRFERVSGMSARGLLRLQADEDLRKYLRHRAEAERECRKQRTLNQDISTPAGGRMKATG